MSDPIRAPRVAIVGGGPAGLMAAEVLADEGVRVDVYDAMPSVGRKFLLAGIGGLNLTHSEPLPQFLARFGARSSLAAPWLDAFGPQALRDWAADLGVATFVGSSGRVFPTDMKAAPLLRAWLHRLRSRGVRFHMRYRWVGWGGTAGASSGGDTAGAAARARSPTVLHMATPAGGVDVAADAVLLALGGASWPRLGSDGAWWPLLQQRGVDLAPLQPANCGFDVARPGMAAGAEAAGWSDVFCARAAGQPLKTVALSCSALDGSVRRQRGEFVFTEGGVEGSLVYALSIPLRDAITRDGRATVHLDLLPDRSDDWVRAEVAAPRGSRSLSSHLKSRLNLDSLKTLLLHELLPRAVFDDPTALAGAIKSLPLQLSAARPIAEAISTAGGVRFEALDAALMLQAVPGVYCAGEMLDWEAPTGGYLLTACMASGRRAGQGALAWVRHGRGEDAVG